VTIRFTYMQKSRNWRVIGPEAEVKLGRAKVMRKNGALAEVDIVRRTSPFQDDNGRWLRIGTYKWPVKS
jgi:hypothetical protein